MIAYFDVIKLIFFVLTIFVSLYELRIKWVVGKSFLDTVGPFILPVYFIFLWLIIWYIIWYLLDMKNDNTKTEKDYTIWFVVWALIWVILSAIFYFIVS